MAKNHIPKRIYFVAAVLVIILTIVGMSSCALEATVLQIGDKIIPDIETNYYFIYQLRAYGIDISTEEGNQKLMQETGNEKLPTVHDVIRDSVAKDVQYVEVFLESAKKDGWKIPSKKGKEESNKKISEIEKNAQSGGQTLEQYVKAVWGPNYTVDDLRYVFERMYTAQDYYDSVFVKTLTTDEADIAAAYEKNPENYDKVNYRMFVLAYTADDTTGNSTLKEKATQMLNQVTDETSFIRLAGEYASEDTKELYAQESFSLFNNTKKEKLNESFASWLFEASRKQGDKHLIETTNGVYVLYYLSRHKPTDKLVNIRELLIEASYNASDSKDKKDAAIQAAKTKAEQILAGIDSEESFSNAVKENSSVSEEIESGGLYESLYNGEQADSISKWCFDPARKAGDKGVVEAGSGYCLLYFISSVDEEEWHFFAKKEAINIKYQDYMKANAKDYKYLR